MSSTLRKALTKLYEYVFKWRWLLLLPIIVVAVVDYCDFGLLVGYGLISRQNKTNLLEVFTAAALALTLYETWKASKEALRQTELTVRPYIRLSWDATSIGPNREAQGLVDTCIVVTNDGSGLMRNVNYFVTVDGNRIDVKRHSMISPKSPTNIVYSKIDVNKSLGCRNSKTYEEDNNKIIQERKITVKGTYRDIEGGQYNFNFESDSGQQSWFLEKDRQQLINRKFYQEL